MIKLKIFVKISLLFLLYFSSPSLIAKVDAGYTESEKQWHYERLLKKLRCVTCPNQNIADSSAPVALAMREEIYRRLWAGESEEAIVHYLLSHYGDYVLYQPLFKKQTLLLWIGPLIMCILAFFCWRSIFSERKVG